MLEDLKDQVKTKIVRQEEATEGMILCGAWFLQLFLEYK